MSYYFDNRRQHYVVYKHIDGKRKYGGHADTEEEAMAMSLKYETAASVVDHAFDNFEMELEETKDKIVFMRPIKRLFATIRRNKQFKHAERILGLDRKKR